ncbi:MAG: AAA family ATPase [Microbacteriaceae bacterium]|nr:AAA family ATPase [Microbacteriaceae bacterium]
MKKTLLGLVGLAGSGKSTAIEIIQSELVVQSIYFGGIVLAEAARQGLPPGQVSEKQVREELRAKDGMSAIAKLALSDIQEAFDESSVVLVDGIYSWAEVEFLKEQGDFELILIAVHADRHLREERLGKRPLRPLTPDGVWSRDLNEVGALDKATPIALADHHITNNADTEELRLQLQSLIDKVRA